jgi:hypothetical protein
MPGARNRPVPGLFPIPITQLPIAKFPVTGLHVADFGAAQCLAGGHTTGNQRRKLNADLASRYRVDPSAGDRQRPVLRLRAPVPPVRRRAASARDRHSPCRGRPPRAPQRQPGAPTRRVQ